MKTMTEDRWLSVEGIADYLGVKRDTVYKWIECKKMPAHKVGSLWKSNERKSTPGFALVRLGTKGCNMVTMIKSREESLARFGFRFERGGAHLARSMMLDDLQRLVQHVPNASAAQEE